MSIVRLAPALLLLAGLAPAQETELTPYTVAEVENLITSFKQTYKNRKTPQEDAVSTLANLKKAYFYMVRTRPEGEEVPKDEEDAAEDIVKLIARRGLFVRKRPLVSLECARVLGEIGSMDAAKYLRKWLDKVIDEKNPHPQLVEYGFQSLAWIGPQDNSSLDLVIKSAMPGKHPDIGVTNQAMRAVWQYRELDGRMRKEFFNKVLSYIGGVYSKYKGGDAKERATYEQRYNAIKENGLKALELLGDGTRFPDPPAALEWWNDNKKRRWEPYYGPREKARRAAAAKAQEAAKKDDKEGDKPAG